MNPLEMMMKELSGNGATVEFKKKRPDGTLEDTSAKQLLLLNTQARLATTAKMLHNMPQKEKTVWFVSPVNAQAHYLLNSCLLCIGLLR